MHTEIIDEVVQKRYTDFDFPPMSRGVLISTPFFSARRVTDVHIYVNNEGEMDQVLFLGGRHAKWK